MHRHHRVSVVWVLAVGCVVGCLQGAERPNVVLILCDDLGYGDVGGFGFHGPVTYTPHIDRLADEGVRLTRFLVPMPYCAPSRASLLTGRYPYHTGLVHNPTPDQGITDYGLDPQETTLAEVLRGGGYRTACVGKWHLGHKPRFLPTRQGFDYYLGILYSNDMRPVQLVENERVVAYPVIQSQLTDRYTRAAIAFMRDAVQADEPFFLYLAHAMPHKPLAPSEAFYTPETPDNLYEDVIRELDHSVGRLVEELRRLDIERNTLLIFTSDNGPTYGGDTGGLRGKKATSWEGGLRVPCVARWPGRIPAGITNRSLASSLDLFPTILGVTGVRYRGEREIDGRDLWPQWTSATAPSAHPYLLAMHGDRLMAVYAGCWKLLVRRPKPYRPFTHAQTWRDPRGPDGVTIIAPVEQYTPADYPGLTSGDAPRAGMLFHVLEDPGEQHDVSAQHPDVVKRLSAYAETVRAQMPPLPRPPALPGVQRVRGGRLDFWNGPNAP